MHYYSRTLLSKYSFSRLVDIVDNDKIRGAEYIVADILSLKDLHSALNGKKFHYVVNLSGYIDHSGYFAGGREVLETHFIGVQNLVQSLCLDSLTAFIQIGSSDEYGDNPAPQNDRMSRDRRYVPPPGRCRRFC